MKRKILSILILILGTTTFYLAGPPPHPNNGAANGGNPGCWPPPCIPIDGGISLLIAAGAVYGGRKLYKNKKEETPL